MSVSLWAYCPEYCDGNLCVGDCDYCPRTDEMAEEEEDNDEHTD